MEKIENEKAEDKQESVRNELRSKLDDVIRDGDLALSAIRVAQKIMSSENWKEGVEEELSYFNDVIDQIAELDEASSGKSFHPMVRESKINIRKKIFEKRQIPILTELARLFIASGKIEELAELQAMYQDRFDIKR